METYQEEESRPVFVVQNVTLGYHFISDIGLSWGPREVKDLTWEDPLLIKRSRNLEASIRSGILKKLTEEEYQKTMEMQYQREKKQLLREQKDKSTYEKVKTLDGNEVDADTFELTKGKQKSAELDITGTANHPMSYVAAYEIASNLAADRGDVITAEEFAEMVEENPNIVPKLLSQTKSASAEFERERKAYYAVPSNEHSNSLGVVQAKMKNINRDALGDTSHASEKMAYIQDALDLDSVDSEDTDFAEEIILDSDE